MCDTCGMCFCVSHPGFQHSGRLSSLKGRLQIPGATQLCSWGSLSSPQGLLSDVLNLNDTTFNCTRHLDLLKATSSRCPATTSAPAFGIVLIVWSVLSGGQGTPLDVAQVRPEGGLNREKMQGLDGHRAGLQWHGPLRQTPCIVLEGSTCTLGADPLPRHSRVER